MTEEISSPNILFEFIFSFFTFMMSSYLFSYSLTFFNLVEEHNMRNEMIVSLPSVDSAFALFNEEFLSVKISLRNTF